MTAASHKLFVVVSVVLGLALICTLNDSLLHVLQDPLRHAEHNPGMRNNSDQGYLHVLRRFIDRRVQVQDVCSKSHPYFAPIKSVTGYKAANLTVCLVRKAASTAWNRLFRYLIDRDHACEKPILSYSKYDINHGYKYPYQKFEVYGSAGQFVKQSVRAMTVRNPYTRLWSAYIDKFYLSDFWQYKGTTIINSVRPDASANSKKCGHDVTFQEFVKYVGTQAHMVVDFIIDSHWLPISDLCDLCRFRPQYIAKQETLVEDFRFIMDRVGLLPVAEEWLFVDHCDFEVKTKIEIWFHHFDSKRECMDEAEFVRRIWNALKLGGDLSPEAQLPQDFDKVRQNSSSLTEMVFAARRKYKVDISIKHNMAERTLREVYKHIPHNDIESLKRLYEFDFQLFGYDSAPPGYS